MGMIYLVDGSNVVSTSLNRKGPFDDRCFGKRSCGEPIG